LAQRLATYATLTTRKSFPNSRGCERSNCAARGALAALLPRLLEQGAASDAVDWEAEAGAAHACAAPRLRWLVWPEADARTASRLARWCPRITLVCGSPPQRSMGACTPHVTARAGACGALPLAAPRRPPPETGRPITLPPPQADLSVALDAPVLAALSPLLIADEGDNAAPACFVAPTAALPVRAHIAELFRRAYEARDLRLAPKRAKNARQRQRRNAKGVGGTEGALARCGAALRAGGCAALLRADMLPVDGLHLCDDS
jgi:hypothetical protein